MFKIIARKQIKVRIFERFFSTQNGKIVPGLGFCRLALLQMGGNIFCDAIKGESTDFIIKFPKMNRQ
ncbi:MAG TPA: hypothetical protein VHZ76_07830 [Gammaproteobacteria bacterium]|nr:hypothetical protein [Gammaproteobacteria bacterium]